MGAGLCEQQDSFLLSTDFPDLTEADTRAPDQSEPSSIRLR